MEKRRLQGIRTISEKNEPPDCVLGISGDIFGERHDETGRRQGRATQFG